MCSPRFESGAGRGLCGSSVHLGSTVMAGRFLCRDCRCVEGASAGRTPARERRVWPAALAPGAPQRLPSAAGWHWRRPECAHACELSGAGGLLVAVAPALKLPAVLPGLPWQEPFLAGECPASALAACGTREGAVGDAAAGCWPLFQRRRGRRVFLQTGQSPGNEMGRCCGTPAACSPRLAGSGFRCCWVFSLKKRLWSQGVAHLWVRRGMARVHAVSLVELAHAP